MARQQLTPPSGHNLLSTMVNTGLLQLLMVVMVLADRCTRAVPVQEYPARKVHVLRRVPAACSNWDKAWAWLTKVDCGTKYRLDYVTVPPREVKQYKLQYVCCDGDTDCKADNVHSSGIDATDEKFLAIVLGSAAACVVIIIIVIAITFYTKKTRCYMCDQEGHVYASADGDETIEGNTDNLKSHPEDYESETDQKGSEVEYAEINDPRLPRYTDIFKENIERKEDPFNMASAPPLYSAVTPQSYINAGVREFASVQSNADERVQINSLNTESLTEDADGVFEEPSQAQHCSATDLYGSSDFDPDALYYNVREKKRKKKRSSACSKSCSTSSNTEDIRIQKNHSSTGAFSKVNGRRAKTNGPICVEMMVKSSSVSESIGEMGETPLTKENLRSTPPNSVDVSLNFTHRNSASERSVSSSSMPRSDSTSACSLSDNSFRSNAIRNKSRQKPGLATSKGNNYDISGIGPPKQLYAMNGVTPSAKAVNQLMNTPADRQLTNAEILACSEAAPRTVACIESESLEARKKSMQASPCHVDCVCDPMSEECEHCCKYDRLQHQPDPDAVSLHIYQCLDDVKHECQELRMHASASCSSIPEISHLENSSIVRQRDSADASKHTERHHRHAH